MVREVLGMMSASITRITVRKQLAAMACERFEIGILQQSGRMLIRHRVVAQTLKGGGFGG